MRITIRHKDLDITPSLAVYIESKIVERVRRLIKGSAGSELPVLDLEFARAARFYRKGRIRDEGN